MIKKNHLTCQEPGKHNLNVTGHTIDDHNKMNHRLEQSDKDFKAATIKKKK